MPPASIKKYLSQTNPGFASYFVTIDDEVVIELMTKPGLQPASADNNHTGWAHLALSVGGAEQVDALAQRAEDAGDTGFAAAYHRRRLL